MPAASASRDDRAGVPVPDQERRPAWRWSWWWYLASLVSLTFVLPVLTAAARLDVKLAQQDAHGYTVFTRHHSGLFIADGLFVALPALVAAALGRAGRWTNLAVAVVILLLAGGCELFVSYSTWTGRGF